MTTTTAGGYQCGITYGQNHWLAWTYPSANPELYCAHSGQTREMAIRRAQERTSTAVGEALRGISTDGVWISEGLQEPKRVPVKAIPKMCHAKDTTSRLPLGTPRGPAARSTEIDIGSVWACYTVVRFVREAKSMDGRDNPVLAVKPSCCGREVEMHRKSLVGAKNREIGCCSQCHRERLAAASKAARERRLRAGGGGS